MPAIRKNKTKATQSQRWSPNKRLKSAGGYIPATEESIKRGKALEAKVENSIKFRTPKIELADAVIDIAKNGGDIKEKSRDKELHITCVTRAFERLTEIGVESAYSYISKSKYCRIPAHKEERIDSYGRRPALRDFQPLPASPLAMPSSQSSASPPIDQDGQSMPIFLDHSKTASVYPVDCPDDSESSFNTVEPINKLHEEMLKILSLHTTKESTPKCATKSESQMQNKNSKDTLSPPTPSLLKIESYQKEQDEESSEKVAINKALNSGFVNPKELSLNNI